MKVTTMQYVQEYFSKFKGEEEAGPLPFPHPLFLLISVAGGFIAMGAITLISALTEETDEGFLALVGSYGALVVLLFGVPMSPFSQPRNIVLGNLIGTIVGVGSRIWIAEPMGTIGFALPFAVSFAFFLMQITSAVNPPSGGTVAICVIGSPRVVAEGWKLVITTTLWSFIFIFVAVIMINAIPGVQYPRYWFVSSTWYYDRFCGPALPEEPPKADEPIPPHHDEAEPDEVRPEEVVPV